MKNLLKPVTLALIILGVILSAWWMLHNDLSFNTDMARDFLLFEDIVKNKPTLIGPRAGGIPGVFHGPLWLYLNVPAFIVGHGNPVVVGWFWVLLFIASIYTLWYVANKFFGKEVAWFAASLYSVVTADKIRDSFNPSGAVYLSPVFFYLFLRYLEKGKFLYLVSSIFTIGLIIQFQVAFGMPLLIMTSGYLIYHVFKTKRFTHLLALFILVIPMSTYIIFELKHQFLQVHSVINFLDGRENSGKLNMTFDNLLKDRLQNMFNGATNYISYGRWWATVMFIVTTVIALIYGLSSKKNKIPYRLFTYFYLGFWAITFLFKGVVWSYYYWPFVPLMILMFASAYKLINKKIFWFIFVVIIATNLHPLLYNAWDGQNWLGKGRVPGTWQYFYQPATRVYKDAQKEFGYYIFTADQFGYSSRYALHYAQSQFPNIKADSFQKKKLTYLFIFPAHHHPYINENWWRANQVKITRKPDEVFTYNADFFIEKYNLTDQEISVTSDPNLLQDLHFR